MPGKSHGHRNLAGYSPWDYKESGMTEHACTHARWTSWHFFLFVFLIVVKYTQCYLHLLAALSSAAMNTGIQVFV